MEELIYKWIEDSFLSYQKINWDTFSLREKDIALSVKTSFKIDVDKLLFILEKNKEN